MVRWSFKVIVTYRCKSCSIFDLGYEASSVQNRWPCAQAGSLVVGSSELSLSGKIMWSGEENTGIN